MSLWQSIIEQQGIISKRVWRPRREKASHSFLETSPLLAARSFGRRPEGRVREIVISCGCKVVITSPEELRANKDEVSKKGELAIEAPSTSIENYRVLRLGQPPFTCKDVL